jgi:hypothetical protein
MLVNSNKYFQLTWALAHEYNTVKPSDVCEKRSKLQISN